MAQINKILVPTDLSKNSKAALPMARQMAQEFKATVILALVTLPPVLNLGYVLGPVAIPTGGGKSLEDAQRMLNETQAMLGDGIAVEQKLVAGDPSEELLNLARSENVDMIIMATHGYTGIKHMLMGSVAERVVRQAPCAVMTVRAEE